MVPVRNERANQIESAVDLGRDGDDADIGPRGRYLLEDILTRPGGPCLAEAAERRRRVTPGGAQAFEWLGSLELRVQKIAFEMRRQDAGAARRTRRPRGPHTGEHAAQRRRIAGNRGRAEA